MVNVHSLAIILARGHDGDGEHKNSTSPPAPDSTQPPSVPKVSTPVVIGALSAAGVTLFALIIWLTYILLKPKKTKQRISVAEDGPRPRLPSEWLQGPPIASSSPFSAFQSNTLRSIKTNGEPQRPNRPDAQVSNNYPFVGPNATASGKPFRSLSPLPPPRFPGQHTRALSREEAQVLAHHRANNTLPRPFTPLAAGQSASTLHMANSSLASSRPSSFAFSRVLSHVRAQPFSIGSTVDLRGRSSTSSFASSFSFASMPYRGSVGAGDASPSVPTATRRIMPGMHVVRTAFEQLLPDEVSLAVGERVTVVDTYDDGWCVVIRSGGDEVSMGAVPAWCFEEAGKERERPPRKASLTVAVEVEQPAPSSPTRRSEVSSFSWSNF